MCAGNQHNLFFNTFLVSIMTNPIKLGIYLAQQQEPLLKQAKMQFEDQLVEEAMEKGIMEYDCEELRKRFCDMIGIPADLSKMLGFTAGVVCEGLERSIRKRYGDKVYVIYKKRGTLRKKHILFIMRR